MVRRKLFGLFGVLRRKLFGLFRVLLRFLQRMHKLYRYLFGVLQ